MWEGFVKVRKSDDLRVSRRTKWRTRVRFPPLPSFFSIRLIPSVPLSA